MGAKYGVCQGLQLHDFLGTVQESHASGGDRSQVHEDLNHSQTFRKWDEQEKMQLTHLRKTIGVSKTASNLIILQETGHLPWVFQRWKLIFRYWNRLIQLDPSRLLYKAFTVSYDLATQGQTSWVSSFLKNSNAIGLYLNYDEPVPVSFTAHYLPFLFKQSLRKKFLASGSKLTTYLTLFGEQFESFEMQSYLTKIRIQKNRALSAKFRSRSHWLRVETGRHENLERCQRTCKLCSNSVVEDEHHMIFDCKAYVELRKEFQHLFEDADAVKQVMDKDENCLAKFIRACYDRRSTLLDQACSKRGGRPPAWLASWVLC